MGSKNNPGAFDCYAKAHPDEPMFILLGRDPMAPSLVALWAGARLHHGLSDHADSDESLKNTRKCVEAMQCGDEMRVWLQQIGRKVCSVMDHLPDTMLVETLKRRGYYVARKNEPARVDIAEPCHEATLVFSSEQPVMFQVDANGKLVSYDASVRVAVDAVRAATPEELAACRKG